MRPSVLITDASSSAVTMPRRWSAPLCLAFAAMLASRQTSAANGEANASVHGSKVVRTAVIGGMTMTGLWSAVTARFEKKTGYRVEVVVTGQRPLLAEALRAGKVDLLTMHSGDITTDLVADGYGVHMRPWTRNQLVIVGPPDDPARVRGMHDGAEALRKIAASRSNFVDARSIGPREMAHGLWRRAGVRPVGNWVLKDETAAHLDLLKFAERKHAYVIVGRMPVVLGKIPRGRMEILVDNDPVMRRPYIVMEANPAKFPGTNQAGARALSDYLLSPEIQRFLLDFGKEQCGGINPFFPVAPEAWQPPG